jgi:hypothetical protein
MAIVQKARATGLTFGELAHQMFQSILSSSRGAKRIDVVFDVYMENSIKSAERLRRSTPDFSTVDSVVSSKAVQPVFVITRQQT